jgi:hypothetical protein
MVGNHEGIQMICGFSELKEKHVASGLFYIDKIELSETREFLIGCKRSI